MNCQGVLTVGGVLEAVQVRFQRSNVFRSIRNSRKKKKKKRGIFGNEKVRRVELGDLVNRADPFRFGEQCAGVAIEQTEKRF